MSTKVNPKKVKLFKDGDQNFPAVNFTISQHRHKNFQTLLDDLNEKVPLPYGVRSIYTPTGRHHIGNLNEFQDGAHYVCSTFTEKKIRKIDYLSIPQHGSTRRPFMVAKSQPMRTEPTLVVKKSTGPRLFKPRTDSGSKVLQLVAKENATKRGKLILNKRTAPNFDAVLQHATDILQMNSGPVESFQTGEGRKVNFEIFRVLY